MLRVDGETDQDKIQCVVAKQHQTLLEGAYHFPRLNDSSSLDILEIKPQSSIYTRPYHASY